MWWNRPYVSVAQKKAKANRLVKSLMKQNKNLMPCRITGRQIAQSFWGKSWCEHFERQADYGNRLPRGRSYVLNDAVCHLEVAPGRVFALVSGSELYEVEMTIKPLPKDKWENIKNLCRGQIATLVDILCGRFSPEVMSVVSHPVDGLFPLEHEISYKCSCPDWAGLCKHVAAVFYGLGNRLDKSPELLFQLRNVDPSELLGAGIDHLTAMETVSPDNQLGGDLGVIFGVELDTFTSPAPQEKGKKATKSRFTLVPAPGATEAKSPVGQPKADLTLREDGSAPSQKAAPPEKTAVILKPVPKKKGQNPDKGALELAARLKRAADREQAKQAKLAATQAKKEAALAKKEAKLAKAALKMAPKAPPTKSVSLNVASPQAQGRIQVSEPGAQAVVKTRGRPRLQPLVQPAPGPSAPAPKEEPPVALTPQVEEVKPVPSPQAKTEPLTPARARSNRAWEVALSIIAAHHAKERGPNAPEIPNPNQGGAGRSGLSPEAIKELGKQVHKQKG
ncbi:MAG: SWIM zinc finger family protein [Deltaproteobacteria bacterium]|jgi:uncharacterized Zn finger protein|nr:SWIM zinc finger family protein [Deltaproteobacteria bacterium]